MIYSGRDDYVYHDSPNFYIFIFGPVMQVLERIDMDHAKYSW